jgi:cytochrome c oxidase accessory protein FixG
MKEDGSRRWLYPKLARGRFWSARRIVAYVLIAIFTLIPHVRPFGRPIMLLDLARRQFTFFGVTFLPTDTVLLALFMVGTILTIFFVTAVFGRVWCGWACPQTVYMEFLFRPIERMFMDREGVGGKPREPMPAWRQALMYVTFLVVCAHLANTFLAYFVPPAELHRWITASPLKHPAGFLVFATVTAMMLFDFCFFREQTCIIACPYGRLQSVLTDRWSMIISYDTRRGEPRGKMKRPVSLPVLERKAEPDAKPPASAGGSSTTGDCVDCDRCVSVCPTGIDIRDGLQIECIGCAQCIDACDAVMDKIGRPRGLIRYGSQATMSGEPRRILRPRVVIYSGIVIVIAGLFSILLANKSPADVTVLRSLGQPFMMTASGDVENTMRVKLVNRTDRMQRFTFSAADREDVKVMPTRDVVEVPPMQSVTEPVQFVAPPKGFQLGALDVTLRLTDTESNVTLSRPVRLLGPMTMGVSEASH